MRIPIAIVGFATTREELQAYVDATTLVDLAHLRTGNFPPIYRSGVLYRNELRQGPFPNVERFQSISSSHVVGYDDCDGLASARAAEILHAGGKARAWVMRNPTDDGWHVVTLKWDDRGRLTVEDPSARLGMLEPEQRSMTNARLMDDEDTPNLDGRTMPGDVVLAGVHTCVGGVVRVRVGAIAGPLRLTATAEEPCGVGDARDDMPARNARRRARSRAGIRALSRLADESVRLAAAPGTLATSATHAAVRSAASATATRANRAAADVSTLDRLGVDDAPRASAESPDDDEEERAEGVNGIDPIAWRLYARR